MKDKNNDIKNIMGDISKNKKTSKGITAEEILNQYKKSFNNHKRISTRKKVLIGVISTICVLAVAIPVAWHFFNKAEKPLKTFISFNIDEHQDKIIKFEKGATIADLEVENFEGYRFDGWYADKNYTQPLTQDTFLSNNVTIYVKYVKTYEVRINMGLEIATLTIDEGTIIGDILIDIDVERSGYEFDGWFTTSDYSIPIDETNLLESELDVYAKYNEVYNIYYEKYGELHQIQVGTSNPLADFYEKAGISESDVFELYIDKNYTQPFTSFSQDMTIYVLVHTLDKLDFVLLEDNTYKAVAKNTSISGIVVIPNTYEGKVVTQVSLEDCRYVTKVILLSNITSIPDEAFYCCEKLSNIDLSRCTSLNTIGEFAFAFTGLTEITIPDSVTTISDAAFLFTILTEIAIPDSVTTIGASAFLFTRLTEITIPDTLTSIGGGAFGGPYLTSIIVEEGNTVYDSRDNCNAIIETATNTLVQGCSSTIIPNVITSIGGGAFAYCNNLFGGTAGLTSIDLSHCTNLTSIGDAAFVMCSDLKSVKLPSSLITIGESAFEECFLPSIDLTVCTNLTTIGTNAFHLNSFESVTIPASVISIGEGGAFYNLTEFNLLAQEGFKWQVNVESKWVDCSTLTSEQLVDYAATCEFRQVEAGYIIDYADIKNTKLSFDVPTYSAVLSEEEGASLDVYNFVIKNPQTASISITVNEGALALIEPNINYTIEEVLAIFESGEMPEELVILGDMENMTIEPLVGYFDITDGAEFKFCVAVPRVSGITPETYTVEVSATSACYEIDFADLKAGALSFTTPTYDLSGVLNLDGIILNAYNFIITNITEDCDITFYSSALSVTMYGNYNYSYFSNILQQGSLYPKDNEDFIGYGVGLSHKVKAGDTLKFSFYGLANSDFQVYIYITPPEELKSGFIFGDMSYGLNEEGTEYSATVAFVWNKEELAEEYGILESAYGLPVTRLVLDGMDSVGCPRSIVVVPSTVKEIYINACHNIETIIINSTQIELFDIVNHHYDNKITSIVISSNVTSIKEGVLTSELQNDFSWIDKLVVELGNQYYKIEGNCLIEIATNKAILGGADAVIPEYITRIGNSAFAWNSNLTTITIPSNVMTIGDKAFAGCDNLTELNLQAKDGWCWVIENKALINYLYEAKVSDLTQDRILIYATDDYKEYTFKQIEDDESLTLLNYTLSQDGTYYIVSSCNDSLFNPNDIVIPSTYKDKLVKEIGNNAFSEIGVANITLPSTITRIGDYAFSGTWLGNYEDLSNCVNLTTIGDYAFSDCSGLIGIDLSGCTSLTSIGEGVFANCELLNIDSVILPSTITSIGKSAFSGSHNSYTIDLSRYANLISIGEYAFSGCNSSSVTLPSSLTTIGEYAFSGCGNLTELNLQAKDGWKWQVYVESEWIDCSTFTSEQIVSYADDGKEFQQVEIE